MLTTLPAAQVLRSIKTKNHRFAVPSSLYRIVAPTCLRRLNIHFTIWKSISSGGKHVTDSKIKFTISHDPWRYRRDGHEPDVQTKILQET
tara:strand:- start:291 stop:560 length:270 start_codon:yes stop_codon:yes gene_type:complete